MKFFINGFSYGRSYFMSFGFTREEFERMVSGAVIERDGNAFWIETEQE